MVKVKFDKEDSDERTSSGWNWFYGTAEVNGKEFNFSLLEMNTKVGGQNTTATEITWVDEIPEGADNIENIIEQQFELEFV